MPSFVDLFCGAGGLTQGLSQAGWKPLLALDNWPDAIQTYRANFRDHSALLSPIEEVNGRDLEGLIDVQPDWVVGGPPCQGFSTIGKRLREDPRNRLVHEFARIVSILQPQGFLIENVIGLKDMRFVDAITELFEGMGYRVSVMVLPAADYGVPQLRRRIFFVGDRSGRIFSRPAPTCSPNAYVTVWDAIGDLPVVLPGQEVKKYDKGPQSPYQELMRRNSKLLQGHVASAHPPHLVEAISHIPDGGNRRDIPESLQPKSGFHNSYSRLHSAAPAVAVTQNMGKPSGTRCIHPFQHRGLTAREGARLQGFPDVFHFSGGVTSQRLQIANAVSPILGKAMAQALEAPASWGAIVEAAE